MKAELSVLPFLDVWMDICFWKKEESDEIWHNVGRVSKLPHDYSSASLTFTGRVTNAAIEYIYDGLKVQKLYFNFLEKILY